MGLIERCVAAWRALVGPRGAARTETDDEAVALRRDSATARLELQEARDRLTAESARLAAMREGQTAAVRDAVDSQLEELFTRLAAPLSQLRMQDALLNAGKPVAAADVMSVSRSLADAVEEAGLEPIGSPGEPLPFDPETSRPLRADAVIEAGEEALVRFVGYRYHGRVIRKALVEKGA